jgi:choice-of-anchor B domain-containing protein
MDLYHFISHGAMGSTGAGSSSWGWVSDDGREFIAIGQEDGTTFAEISSEGKLVVLARLPQVSLPSDWREIRSYKNYMIIGSEAVGHGIQIFDMTKLLDIDVEESGVVIYDALDDLTGYTNHLPAGRSHNVVVNEEKDYIVAVGAQPRTDECLSGLIFFDVSDPSDPVRVGCAAGDGYVHDVSYFRHFQPLYPTDLFSRLNALSTAAPTSATTERTSATVTTRTLSLSTM